MTAGELKRLLQDVPDSMPIAIEHSAGTCFEEEAAVRVEDGFLVVTTDARGRWAVTR